ncbi:MAG: DUF1840 domain-containing protein [Hydrogenophaga sp.]|uniref:DUF1840 domain-containing protein n=1 Tax=Hydrogenophaga sp. TaxID=1904254 RepID=UPI003D0BFCA9
MSVYRFKSRETGELVMLEPHAKRLLQILGKDPSGPGVVLPDQMASAVEALRTAAVEEDAFRKRLREEAQARGEPAPDFDPVSLRMRSTPFIEMLQRAEKAGVEVVWGV